MRIQCLQHVAFEGPAGIADWATDRGHKIEITPLYQGADPPETGSFDWLVVMGGPMGVSDEGRYPWLGPEKAFIADAIASGKTVVGVCLGAQLIAEALGARVYPNREKEIGWMPVELTDAGRGSRLFGFLPAEIEVFHWHGDTFDLPAGAVHLARSGPCANQAFVHDGRVLGLQFHLESTPGSVAAIVAECADEIVPAPHIQGAARMLAAGADDYARLRDVLCGVLDRLAEGGTGP
jgi:GMP synthase-like glutamine amidotransferase